MGQSKSMNFECITAAQKQQQQESQVHPHAGKLSLETDFSVREKSLATQISAAEASTETTAAGEPTPPTRGQAQCRNRFFSAREITGDTNHHGRGEHK
jgi:hypothetical protein